MNFKEPGRAPLISVLAAGILTLAGCASLSSHLPWGHRTPPPPELSTALTVAAPDGSALAWPQFWQRNDVVLDMSGVAGTGSAVIAPRSGLAWPVRVALRITPGAVGAIDVRGAQRWVVPVNPGAKGTLDIELPAGVYKAVTRQILVSWGPAPVAASAP